LASVKEIKVSDPQSDILNSTKNLNLFLAGVGSGKTHCIALGSADFIINFPNALGLIAANTYSQLSKSTLKRVFETWYDVFGWVNGIHYVSNVIPPESFKRVGQPLESYKNVITFNNGATIFTASLDNYKVLDGTELGYGFLDETKDTREEAVKEVIVWRMRQKAMFIDKDGVIYNYAKPGTEGYNPLYIFTSPAKVYWLNEWFGISELYDEISQKIFSKTDYFRLETKNKLVTISSTFHNEDNLPAGYIQKQMEEFAGNKDKIDMLIYGSPIAKSGGEMFVAFNRIEHCRNIEIDQDAPIHISLDFNVVPYITMTCWQIVRNGDNYNVNCFAEYCLEAPNNKTEALCKFFEQRVLLPIKHAGKEIPSLFYYGDASGRNNSTNSDMHNYDILEKVLGKYLNNGSDRVIRRNPSIVRSRDFVNKLFAGGYPNIKMNISNSCKNLIKDLEFLKEAPDGGKLIEKTKDEKTGQTYEKYGHTSDSMRYLLVGAFPNLYKPD
jgi:hypothetical protein